MKTQFYHNSKRSFTLEHITDALASFHWLRASSSNCRSQSTELFTALHLSTCRTGCCTSLIYRRDNTQRLIS